MARKKVVVVSENVSHGLTYQRIHLPLSRLSRDEWDFECIDIDDFRHSDAMYTDAVVMNHPTRTNEFFELAHRCKFHYKIPCIVDIDDLLTDLQVDHPEYRNYVNNRVCELLGVSASVVVSTNYLKREWGHLNKNISVIENTIDTARYENMTPVNKPYHSGFVIGWTGGGSHRADQLYTFLPGLMRFLDEVDEARCYFHVLCPQILKDRYGSRIIHEPHIFDYFDYDGIKAAYPIDVMLVGLYQHPFNEAKSDLKLLEMAPHRIPLIASPREEFKRHRDKELMLLVEETNDGWYTALKTAYENRDLLNKTKENAYNYVMKERDVAIASKQWEMVLMAAIERYAPFKSVKA